MTKWLALIFMLIDHIAYIFSDYISNDVYVIMRMLGRLSFPLFTYFIIMGLNRTSNLKSYISRMFVFGVISELAIRTIPGLDINYLNIMFTFFSYSILYVLIFNKLDNKYNVSKFTRGLLGILIIIFLIPNVDYFYSGLLMFLGLLWLHKADFGPPKNKHIAVAIILLSFLPSIIFSNLWIGQLLASVAGLLMFNRELDERIFNPKFEKWAFYIIYPLQWIIFSIFIRLL